MLTPQNLLYAAIGVTIGTLVGVLPGIGPALTIALLLPVALKLDDPIGTLIMFAGIYYGAMYGGSTTSILLNTPGESASVATSIEGYQMAQRGRARAALATAAIGSFVAAIITTVLLTFVMEPMARLAVTFRASDYFALAVLAMVTVTAVVGASLVRGLMSLVFGLFLGLVGIDALTGQARFTFGVPSLLRRHRRRGGHRRAVRDRRDALHRRRGCRQLPAKAAPLEPAGGVAWLSRGRLVALVAAVAARHRARLPVRGAALRRRGDADVPVVHVREAALEAPARSSGSGAIEGVAGPEAANNASFSGVLVPLLTLGIPTSATAAVMLAAFSYFDISPGPQLFENQSDAGVGADRVAVHRQRHAAGAEPAADPAVGEGAADPAAAAVHRASWCSPPSACTRCSGSIVDVLIAYAIGVVAMFMRHLDFPIAPAILGLILGPMMETQFRRALLLSDGDLSVFVTRPLTLILLLLAVAALGAAAPAEAGRPGPRPPRRTPRLAGTADSVGLCTSRGRQTDPAVAVLGPARARRTAAAPRALPVRDQVLQVAPGADPGQPGQRGALGRRQVGRAGAQHA